MIKDSSNLPVFTDNCRALMDANIQFSLIGLVQFRAMVDKETNKDIEEPIVELLKLKVLQLGGDALLYLGLGEGKEMNDNFNYLLHTPRGYAIKYLD